MSLSAVQKAEIVEEHKRGERDTGSPEVQVALLSAPYCAPDGALPRTLARFPLPPGSAEARQSATQAARLPPTQRTSSGIGRSLRSLACAADPARDVTNRPMMTSPALSYLPESPP